MENNELQNFDECLAHYGTRGMKWGIRRYQNKDGTLTAKGKKRYAKELERLKKEEAILKNKKRTQAQLDKLEAKRKSIEEQKRALSGKPAKEKSETDMPAADAHAKIGKKKVKDMTDAELKAVTNRLQLEKNYRDAMQALSPKADKGKSFAQSLKNDVIAPGLKEAGKQATQKAGTYVANQIGAALKKAIEESKKK